MIDIANNNELAKPMAKNNDDIYGSDSNSARLANGDVNPYAMDQSYLNADTYPVTQKQVIII